MRRVLHLAQVRVMNGKRIAWNRAKIRGQETEGAPGAMGCLLPAKAGMFVAKS
jgi:hypothetical protein